MRSRPSRGADVDTHESIAVSEDDAAAPRGAAPAWEPGETT